MRRESGDEEDTVNEIDSDRAKKAGMHLFCISVFAYVKSVSLRVYYREDPENLSQYHHLSHK